MDIIINLALAFFIYLLSGAGILAYLDKDRELFAWYASAPRDWIKVIVLILWPLVIMFYLLGRKRNDNAG